MKRLMNLLLALILIMSFVSCTTVSGGDVDATETATGEPTFNAGGELACTPSYFTFRDVLLETTDVVKAECLSVTDKYEYSTYEFRVSDRFYGEDVSWDLPVVVSNTYVTRLDDPDYFRYDHEVEYTIGEEYYLLLIRHHTPYVAHDVYTVTVSTVVIPADDIPAAVCGKRLLSECVGDHPMRTEEDLQAYFAEQLKPEEQTYFAVAWDVIPGDDLGTILRESDLVLKVKVGEQFIIGADRVSYYVTVTSFLKGDVELWEKVTIPFPFDSVKEGDECIVSLWNPGPGLLVFSSRNSLYDLSMEEEIRSILAAQAE